MKDEFILKEIWLLSLMGAFQRAGVYVKNTLEIEKKEFRELLYQETMIIASNYKNLTIDRTSHIKNIKKLQNFSRTCSYSHILNDGTLNFGISQKLLNLVLKFLWYLEKIETPPHFPVDRIVQQKLNELAKRQHKKVRKIIPWTKIKNEKQYLEIINFASSLLDNTNCESIAKLELMLFNER